MFEFRKLEIPGVILIVPQVYHDERGFFLETYKKREFAAAGIRVEFVQDNHSCSTKGTIRGLHYQLAPYGQAKLIKVLVGSVLDVAVDIRHGSPTFGRWASAVLSAQNKQMMWIPEGFAHGFLALEDGCEIFYKNSNEYHPEAMRSILWNDPAIDIDWGDIEDPILTAKDANAPTLAKAEINFVYGGEK